MESRQNYHCRTFICFFLVFPVWGNSLSSSVKLNELIKTNSLFLLCLPCCHSDICPLMQQLKTNIWCNATSLVTCWRTTRFYLNVISLSLYLLSCGTWILILPNNDIKCLEIPLNCLVNIRRWICFVRVLYLHLFIRCANAGWRCNRYGGGQVSEPSAATHRHLQCQLGPGWRWKDCRWASVSGQAGLWERHPHGGHTHAFMHI